MAKRASLKKTLRFCNKIREAGGVNPLDALMPAYPSDSQGCLIALNLNFSCEVGGGPDNEHARAKGIIASKSGYKGWKDGIWWMTVEDVETGLKIAKKLKLQFIEENYVVHILLPADIGQVAADFDRWEEFAETKYDERFDDSIRIPTSTMPKELEEFTKYVVNTKETREKELSVSK